MFWCLVFRYRLQIAQYIRSKTNSRILLNLCSPQTPEYQKLEEQWIASAVRQYSYRFNFNSRKNGVNDNAWCQIKGAGPFLANGCKLSRSRLLIRLEIDCFVHNVLDHAKLLKLSDYQCESPAIVYINIGL